MKKHADHIERFVSCNGGDRKTQALRLSFQKKSILDIAKVSRQHFCPYIFSPGRPPARPYFPVPFWPFPSFPFPPLLSPLDSVFDSCQPGVWCWERASLKEVSKCPSDSSRDLSNGRIFTMPKRAQTRSCLPGTVLTYHANVVAT